MTEQDNFSTTEDPNAEDGVTSDDATWILTATFIIFTMQTGFGMLESGCVTKKNEVNILIKNLVDVVFGGITYWAFGYGLQYGEAKGANPVFGVGKFIVDSDSEHMGSTFTTFIFQLSFSTTATTIVSGAMAERTDFTAYCIFSFLNTITYCVPAGWIWSNRGFLKALGFIDFAGSCAVHLLGGCAAIVSTLFIGPRLRRYDMPGSPPLGSAVNVTVGTLILWWGWLGFNCGSTFGISGTKWLFAGRAAITTINASLLGGIVGVFWGYGFCQRLDVPCVVNGLLGGLVSVTASCAYVEPWHAMVIGGLGAVVASIIPWYLDRIHMDDPVGAIAVHFGGGLWGTIAVGLFAQSGTQAGLFAGGGWYLLGVQILGAVCTAAWSLGTTYLLLKGISFVRSVRMSAWVEVLGADLVEHAVRHDQINDYEERFQELRRRGFACKHHPWITHVHPVLIQREQLQSWISVSKEEKQSNTQKRKAQHRPPTTGDYFLTRTVSETHLINPRNLAELLPGTLQPG
ncbi:unnamed protein product [Cyprideis torosa]|uniref:Ammonium transporter n=1 Tax=Cyprideis torosa TaxID=163714 RepID=A0A7R8ZKR0_9CRUS|nr:unnamed protein product [Cyprideis torosa]CAG0891668.1 unnamed protein product [Cyprideis torosa]